MFGLTLHVLRCDWLCTHTSLLSDFFICNKSKTVYDCNKILICYEVNKNGGKKLLSHKSWTTLSYRNVHSPPLMLVLMCVSA